MKTLELDDATLSLAEYARQATKEPVIVTKGGKPVAALVSIENVDWETLTLSTDSDFLGLIERSRKAHVSKGGVSSADMRRRFSVETE